ncbi:MAG: iron ABC transporter substrate-binding protein [Candidatus Bathyarchaeota archaeon]|nr:iron ABC transporter substrate-binding protein [Candidatus Termiticorpusculum sp.]
MKKLVIYAILGVVILIVSMVAVYSFYGKSPIFRSLSSTQDVVDMTGRTVTVPNDVTRVIAVNSGALRLVTYLDAASMICGIEQHELDLEGRPYAMANPQYATLPVIGPQFGGDPELIAAQKPDVVFTTETDIAKLDALQNQIGIPVIGIVYGSLNTADAQQIFYDSLTLIGKVIHSEDRAAEVIAYVKGLINDLNTRTANIPDANKPPVYVGGLSARGSHGFTSTSAAYAPFTLTNSKNVITLEMAKGSTQVVNVDIEALPSLNPAIIFVDYNGIDLIKEDIQRHKDVYSQLDAIRNGRVYGVMGYNWYTLNFDVVLTDAYYIGTALYPNQFNDVNPQQKADEIYTFLCGAPLYDQMVNLYGPFGQVNIT